ncbi:MAG: DNA-binding Lrp family transcriptional regulator [Halioglobus sp.]|jgi:DNA-binding Lrp family transcriptional regulator
MDMDELDKKLLSLLRINSRATTSSLARELGVSRSTVQDRITRLERRNIIAGYTVRYHQDFGGRLLKAHVMIQVNPKHSTQIVEALRSIAAVKTLQTVSGIYDLVTLVEAVTTQEMDGVLDTMGQLPGVEKTTTSIVLATKFER